MTELEKLRQWLPTFPQWEAGGLLYLDHLDAMPGNTGLYPGGLEVIGRKEDVLGNVTENCRYRFGLYRMTARGEDNTAAAQWLLDFQNWVQRQSRLGLAPTFGDDPAKETLYAQKGRLKEGSQAGSGVYVVELTAEFIRKG